MSYVLCITVLVYPAIRWMETPIVDPASDSALERLGLAKYFSHDITPDSSPAMSPRHKQPQGNAKFTSPSSAVESPDRIDKDCGGAAANNDSESLELPLASGISPFSVNSNSRIANVHSPLGRFRSPELISAMGATAVNNCAMVTVLHDGLEGPISRSPLGLVVSVTPPSACTSPPNASATVTSEKRPVSTIVTAAVQGHAISSTIGDTPKHLVDHSSQAIFSGSATDNSDLQYVGRGGHGKIRSRNGGNKTATATSPLFKPN